MSGNILILSAARRDLVEGVAYLAERSEATARRFRAAAEATLQKLASQPGMGTCYEPDDAAYGEVRFFPVSRFPKYLVFYRPVADGIEVIRVLHSARDISTLLVSELGISECSDDEGNPPADESNHA